jgi:hypothetical protein
MTPAVRLALSTLVMTAVLVPVTTAVASKGGASPGVPRVATGGFGCGAGRSS